MLTGHAIHYLETVHLPHGNVKENQIKGVLSQTRQRLMAVTACLYFVPLGAQQIFQAVTDAAFIIDDEDFLLNSIAISRMKNGSAN